MKEISEEMRAAATARTENERAVVCDSVKALFYFERPHHDRNMNVAANHFSDFLAKEVMNEPRRLSVMSKCGRRQEAD